MICKAERTLIGVPSASSTFEKREYTSMPGPMALWAKSTGAMLDCCSFFRAGLSSRFNVFMKSRRVQIGAFAGRLRQTRTIEEASALVFMLIARYACSERIGHVPVKVKPD